MESKANRLIALAWILGILIIIFIKPPYWALMDDATNLSYIDKIQENQTGFFKFIKEYSHKDKTIWGMFRPVYPAYVYIFYSLFQHHSHIGYALNILIVLGVFMGFAWLYSRITWREGFWIFVALACIFTPHYNLFFFASLQEKLLLIGGLGLFTSIYAAEDKNKNPWIFALLAALGYLFGVYSKATTLFMSVPVVVWLTGFTLDQKKRAIPFWLFLIPLFIYTAWFFSSIRSSYSSGYQTANLIGKLLSSGPRFQGPALIGVFSVLYGFGAWAIKREKQKSYLELAHLLFWPVGLLAYLAIMLPWREGVGYYLLSPAGVFLVGSLVTDIRISRDIIHPKLVLLTPVLLVGLSIYAGPKLLLWARQHHHTRDVAQYIRENFKDKENIFIAMPEPCYEARTALGFVSGYKGGINLAQANRFPEPPPDKRRILISDRYCPANNMTNFEVDVTLLDKSPWFIQEDL